MARSDQRITPSQIEAMAKSGKTAREIAMELGVSRQLVYRIAQQFEIALPSPFRWRNKVD